jgi:mannose-1-phosphate guanylyltransferase
MAGGSGTRFWPRSREIKSKQFLNIIGKKSLIQITVKRYNNIVGYKNTYVVAKKNQQEILEKHIPEVPPDNILYEPQGKNTAPCIGLASLSIHLRDPDGIMIVSPSDHLIRKEASFMRTINRAVDLASEKSSVVTIGITPSRPSTGYGYIQIDGEEQLFNGIKSYKIKTFAEKPNLETARRFVESGDFFWNSGIFIFKASLYLKLLEEYLPEIYDGLMEVKKHYNKPDYEDVLNRVYQQIRSISIDYGIIEKIKDIYMVKGDFVWSDLGSWEEIYKLSDKDKKGNVTIGNTLILDTKNTYIFSDKGIIAAIGLEDIVVVQEDGATLICRRDKAEDVKTVVDQLKRLKLLQFI